MFYEISNGNYDNDFVYVFYSVFADFVFGLFK